MTIADYSPPVSQLLTHPEPYENFEDWSNYLNLGITAEHIPELIQMVGDQSLYTDQTEDESYWAAPIHAWRTLGELKAEAAILPLIDVIRNWGDEENWGEWIVTEIPSVFGAIGPAALPALQEYIADSTQPNFCLDAAISAIAQIGLQHPEYRDQSVAILTQKLENFAEQDEELNAFLVTPLVADLKAVESAAVIEQAFAANKVDESFVGDWDEAQVYLGLKTREEVPRKRFAPIFERSTLREPSDPVMFNEPSGFGGGRQTAKKKAKRKQQKESRRKNRTKKKK